MLKRIIVLVIASVMVIGITSCNSFSSRKQDNGQLEVIFIINSLSPFGMSSPEEYDEWETKYNEVFDDDISITGIVKSSKELYNEFNIKSIIDETEGGGVVVMPLGYYCSIQDEIPLYFEPLDKYINESGLVDNYPISVLEFGINPKDGLTWCVPVHQYNERFVRFYSKEALDTLGIQPPDTLEGLKEALVDYNVKYGKPGLIISEEVNNNPFASIADIFALAGINYPETIFYDSNSGKFINIIDNPKTTEILEYIQELYVSEIVHLYDEDSRIHHFSEMRENGLLTLLFRGAGGINDELIVPGSLSPDVSSVLPGDQRTYFVALMLKDTKGGYNEFREFSDIFLKPGSGYIAASLGFENVHYDVKESRRQLKKYRDMPDPEMACNFLYMMDTYSMNNDSEAYFYYVDEYMSDRNIIYPAHVEYIYLNMNRNIELREFRDYFSIYFMDAIKEGIDLDKAIEQYRYECSHNGIDALILDSNAKLSDDTD
ncbi:MAG: hypothetical protein R3232_06965 [Clostridia bacterium]|nr:hypothetical protein [Clostridia bacterium]